MTERKRKIGFVGLPPEEVLAPRRSHELIDLDNLLPGVKPQSEAALPRTTCRILRRIFDNALALDLEEIVIDEGYGKCDGARGLAEVLEETLHLPVLRTQNANRIPAGTPISDSNLPLKRKVELILEGLVTPAETGGLKSALPKAAFWGVPAADFAIYELFPEGTQVLGWTRCLENRTPANWELELWAPEGLPTIFFSQTFCAKNLLAKHLAKKHGGLYVDVDGVLTQPVRAKIEAFLRFRGVWN